MKDRFYIDKLHKKIAALMISTFMGISVISVPLNTKAEELQDDFVEQTDMGIMEVQSVEVSRLAVLKGQLEQIADQDEDGADDIFVKYRDWKQYSDSYVYDKLDSKEKELYDDLDLVCKNFIEDSSEDALYLEDKNGNGGDYLSAVTIDKDLIDSRHPMNSKFIDVVQLFIYANPQYYFTTSSYAKSGNKLYLFCYPAFADGEDRAIVTNELFTEIDSWLENINENNNTSTDIEKYTHDFLCNTLSYDHDSSDKMEEGDYSGDVYYSQSIYSAIKKNKTVCAGYSLTFELLMNASGVPTVTAYSDYHAWNKVNFGDDKWYAVDVTWDDQDKTSRIDYSFYNKSDESIKFSDDNLPIHVAKTAKYYPVAEKDFVVEKQTVSTMNNQDKDSEESDVNDVDTQEVIDDNDNTSNVNDNDAEDVVDDNQDVIEDENNQNDYSGDNYNNDNNNNNSVLGNVKADNTDSDNNTNKTVIENDTNNKADTASKATVEVSQQKKTTTTSTTNGNNYTYNTNHNDKNETVEGTKIKKIKSYSKKIKVSWNKADNISGYEIQISTSKKFKKNVKTIKASENSSGVWIKKLKKHTKYYVRIRTYMYLNTDKLMSEWSGVKKVTTKK